MTRVRRSHRADADLLDIFLRIAAENPAAAENLIRRIDEACRRIAEFPEMGAKRDVAGAGIRMFPIAGHLIFYRPDPKGIYVVRVLHGARDWRHLVRSIRTHD